MMTIKDRSDHHLRGCHDDTDPCSTIMCRVYDNYLLQTIIRPSSLTTSQSDTVSTSCINSFRQAGNVLSTGRVHKSRTSSRRLQAGSSPVCTKSPIKAEDTAVVLHAFGPLPLCPLIIRECLD